MIEENDAEIKAAFETKLKEFSDTYKESSAEAKKLESLMKVYKLNDSTINLIKKELPKGANYTKYIVLIMLFLQSEGVHKDALVMASRSLINGGGA